MAGVLEETAARLLYAAGHRPAAPDFSGTTLRDRGGGSLTGRQQRLDLA